MNQKISKKIIIQILLIVFVVGGLIVFFISNKKVPVATDEKVQQEEVTETSNTIQQNLVTDSAPKIKFDDKNKELFDDLMSRGNTAFLAKEYEKAVSLYQQALKYNDADVIYARLFTIYNIQGDNIRALESINNAILKFPSFTEYWITKLVYLDEKTKTSFSELKKIYTEGLNKVDAKTKSNLATTFARIAEGNGMKNEAISAWEKAIELYPSNKAIYQAEIDRLKTLK